MSTQLVPRFETKEAYTGVVGGISYGDISKATEVKNMLITEKDYQEYLYLKKHVSMLRQEKSLLEEDNKRLQKIIESTLGEVNLLLKKSNGKAGSGHPKDLISLLTGSLRNSIGDAVIRFLGGTTKDFYLSQVSETILNSLAIFMRERLLENKRITLLGIGTFKRKNKGIHFSPSGELFQYFR